MEANTTQGSIASVTMVKAPLAQIQYFVDYHLKLGVDLMIFFFDDPNDETHLHFKDNPKVLTIVSNQAYWTEQHQCERPTSSTTRQRKVALHAMEIARSKNIEWITHIDVDELINTPKSQFKQILAQTKLDVIKYDLFEAIPEKLAYKSIFEPTLFRRKPKRRLHQRIAKALCPEVYFFREFFRAHKHSKVIVRLAAKHINIDIHCAYTIEDDQMYPDYFEDGITLLHYDSIGVENWKQKFDWRIDKSTDKTDRGAKREYILSKYIEAKAVGPQAIEKLYKDIYCLSNKSRWILLLVGMACKVNHKDNLK